jgi:hypothetical protein
VPAENSESGEKSRVFVPAAMVWACRERVGIGKSKRKSLVYAIWAGAIPSA